MRVRHDNASHRPPESRACVREDARKASVRERTGRLVISKSQPNSRIWRFRTAVHTPVWTGTNEQLTNARAPCS